MISSQVSLISTFFLGALHSLEPGHGKSIIALHTAKSNKLSDTLSLLATILLSHFVLVLLISTLIYFQSSWFDLAWIRLLAPVLIIGYGLFLLVKSRGHNNSYIACSCSHEEEATHKAPKQTLMMGIMAGLTPCPSVFAPIVMAMSLNQIDFIFLYLASYISGVITLFILLVLVVHFLTKNSSHKLEAMLQRSNPHLISGIILIIVGFAYLIFSQAFAS